MIDVNLRELKNFEDVEIAACKMTWRAHCYLYNWYRLVPGATELEPLGTWNDGSYDALDASKERNEKWPNAVDVSYCAIANESLRRKGESYLACDVPGCTKVAYGQCNICDDMVCIVHHEEGDFESWCVWCWDTHVDMLRIDGQIEDETYQELIQERITRKGERNEL